MTWGDREWGKISIRARVELYLWLLQDGSSLCMLWCFKTFVLFCQLLEIKLLDALM